LACASGDGDPARSRGVLVIPTPTQPLESHLASAERARFASAPPDRPGLGTKWGEKRISLVGTASFERANFNHPFAAAAIYYNDEAGIRAMAGTVAWERRVPVLAEPAAALVTIELRDQSGRILPDLIVGDRWFVVGEEGRRYSIVVRTGAIFVLRLCSPSMASMSSMAGPLHFANAVTSLIPIASL